MSFVFPPHTMICILCHFFLLFICFVNGEWLSVFMHTFFFLLVGSFFFCLFFLSFLNLDKVGLILGLIITAKRRPSSPESEPCSPCCHIIELILVHHLFPLSIRPRQPCFPLIHQPLRLSQHPAVIYHFDHCLTYS